MSLDVTPVLQAIVATLDDRVVGWGSLSNWNKRCAYRSTVEDSVYVHADLTTATISLRDAIGRSAPVRLERIGRNLILDVSGLPVGLYTISVAVHGQPVTSARVMVAR